jgi:hypothetical protein
VNEEFRGPGSLGPPGWVDRRRAEALEEQLPQLQARHAGGPQEPVDVLQHGDGLARGQVVALGEGGVARPAGQGGRDQVAVRDR